MGASKFGAVLKVKTPVPETRFTVAESTPLRMLQVTASFAVAVPIAV
ncbi:unannotated protein [freshwater metagenome]|uniref:Unannotated protein n=1 Tax=freshwater metagenome TaxID=449393 RepID=A0A6J6T597_9ZZZZ